ncbi:MAG: hypothetical protein COW02_14985 [Comamonadaceae bacterium CG12_big_fil_rev_8_21_14_0_65_59_15]|nr:MAG: hypothetical protein COW02_14985 [Comamonadaceae bacterium CG12_big_fil_rev_8_21_14_0_65_59_15]
MQKILLATLLAMPLSGIAAGAQMIIGKQLIEMAAAHTTYATGDKSAKNAVQSTLLLGYVMGVADAATALGGLCTPLGIKRGELANIVIQYLSKNPQVASDDGQNVVYDALRSRYPGTKK